MFTLRHLQFLIAVADTSNFSRAAEISFVTQPTLSAGIKELEDRLGVRLIERTRRSVMLTPLGDQIVERARALLLDAKEIEELAHAHQDPEIGDLRLGAIPTIGPYLIPQALPLIRARFPGLRLYLREEMTESLIEGLNKGRLDVILIALPFDTGSLEIRHLFEDGYQLATPPNASQPRQTGHSALKDVGQLMLLEKGHCLQRHALQAYPDRPLEQDETFAATSLTTLVAMVSEGLGVTLLPNLAIDAGIVSKAEVSLTPLPDACPRQIVLAWRTNSARKDLFVKLSDVLCQTRQLQNASIHDA
ncbi:LysR family hydrogen peroxide-inducible transcriptional activator [Primorskyibacter sedentarius]|uniref:LysR family hydrogen peroxide-inducible transcriptional activator n=2 Tax=Primorskyibacter sedentarius TaxID=745311 RepID=A0A4R3J3I9_9RHOB|nr:hydrogen peroxide-inducible genes activator [Primorskyibacter sedentarius]TCS59745.1 LysR family hydrogen peroxide-inducible transcriptional activator [Primorskyibacter sedentarius]